MTLSSNEQTEPASGNPGGHARTGRFWLALHFGVAMAAADLLINLYHEGHHLDFVYPFLPPALALGGAAAIVHLLVSLLAARGLALPADRLWNALAALSLALGSVICAFQWVEATPYYYSQLPRLLTFANIALAVAGHLTMTFRRPAERGTRFSLAGSTGIAYFGGAINLATWFYIAQVEGWLGSERTNQLETAAIVIGIITFSLTLVCLSMLVGAATSGKNRIGFPVRLVAVSLPYIALAAAGWIWIGEYGDSLRIPSLIQGLMQATPLLAAIAVISAALLKGPRSLMVPVLATLLLLALGSAMAFRHDLLGRVGFPGFRSDTHRIRHVILLTVDTLRSDVLEPYGGTEIDTPNIKALAEDSVVFEDAMSSAPWTLPSFSAILTGLSPGVFGKILPVSRIGKEVETVAERFASAGYFTGAVGLNPLLRPRQGLDQGFITHEMYPLERRSKTLGAKLIDFVDPDYFRTDPDSAQLTRRGIAWLDTHHKKDFFFWFHFYDPHAPWGPPEPFRPEGDPPLGFHEPWDRPLTVGRDDFTLTDEEKSWIRLLYLNEVRYVDHCIGQLTARLKELGLYDDALIVFSSDHGEELWDHGGFQHGHTLYQELVHVPLMIKLPGQAARGRVAQAVSTVSITPTLLDLTDVPFDPAFLSAPSLAPLTTDPEAEIESQPMFTENTFRVDRIHESGVRFGNLKMMTGLDEIGEHLFDLEADPGEKKDLGESQSDNVGEGVRFLMDYREHNAQLRQMHGIEELGESALTEDAIDRLRDLGYIQ